MAMTAAERQKRHRERKRNGQVKPLPETEQVAVRVQLPEVTGGNPLVSALSAIGAMADAGIPEPGKWQKACSGLNALASALQKLHGMASENDLKAIVELVAPHIDERTAQALQERLEDIDRRSGFIKV